MRCVSYTRRDKQILKGTFAYYMGLVCGMTVAEALVVLRDLGSYHVDAIWYTVKDPTKTGDDLCVDAAGTYWEHVAFDKMPVNSRCKIKHIAIPIRFFGGPPGDACYYMGRLSSFVCDRILQCVTANGKTKTSTCILQSLSRVRRKRNGRL